MTTHDINLPPLRRPQVPRIDADIALADERRLVDWCEKTARSYARAAIEADRKRRSEPVEGERFLRAWVNLDKLPGGVMVGPEGRFGPTPASTSCWITTSEREAERLKAKGPVLEIWATPQPAEPSGASNLHKYSCGAQNENQAPQPAETVKVPNKSEGEL